MAWLEEGEEKQGRRTGERKKTEAKREVKPEAKGQPLAEQILYLRCSFCFLVLIINPQIIVITFGTNVFLHSNVPHVNLSLQRVVSFYCRNKTPNSERLH